jgi:hypothetical protein
MPPHMVNMNSVSPDYPGACGRNSRHWASDGQLVVHVTEPRSPSVRVPDGVPEVAGCRWPTASCATGGHPQSRTLTGSGRAHRRRVAEMTADVKYLALVQDGREDLRRLTHISAPGSSGPTSYHQSG